MLPTNSLNQRQRLLAHLVEHHRITTIDARLKLDILHPAARVFELKALGYSIVSYRRTVDTGHGNRHKVAEYVLIF